MTDNAWSELDDWGDGLDDFDGAFWEYYLGGPDDDSPSDSNCDSYEYSFDESDDESNEKSEPLKPTAPTRAQTRTFAKYDEAKSFLKHVVKRGGDKDARLTRDENGFQVCYRSWGREPIADYRTGRRYTKLEARFILKQYLMWVPVERIAVAVDRKVTAVELWLNERGLRIWTRNPVYGIGKLEEFAAKGICDEIGCNFIYGKNLNILQQIGVLLEPPAVGPSPKHAPLVRVSELSTSEKKRLLEFTLDYGKLELASYLATETGQYMLGFIAGMQCDNPAAASTALANITDLPLPLAKVKRATLSYLRSNVIRQLTNYITVLREAQMERLNDSSFRDQNELHLDKELALAKDLAAAMATSPIDWPLELRTLYESLRHEILDARAESGDSFSAWIIADNLRKTIFNNLTQSCKIQLEKYMRLAGDFRLNVERINELMTSALPYDKQLAALVSASRQTTSWKLQKEFEQLEC